MRNKAIDTMLVYLDPELKRQLRAKLALKRKTVSEWVREQAKKFIKAK